MTGVAETAADATLSALRTELLSFIRRRVSDEHLAEDLLQETFVRIAGGLAQLRDDTRVGAWAFRIARNVVIDHRRGKRVELPIGERHEPQTEPADVEPSDSHFVGAWLMSQIPRLPPAYREAVRLAEVEGLPQAEVAHRLGLSLSGAKSRVQRGREHLRAVLRRCCEVEFDRRGNVVSVRCRSCGCDHSTKL